MAKKNIEAVEKWTTCVSLQNVLTSVCKKYSYHTTEYNENNQKSMGKQKQRKTKSGLQDDSITWTEYNKGV